MWNILLCHGLLIDVGKTRVWLERHHNRHKCGCHLKLILFNAHHTDMACVIEYTDSVLNYCVMECLWLTRQSLLQIIATVCNNDSSYNTLHLWKVVFHAHIYKVNYSMDMDLFLRHPWVFKTPYSVFILILWLLQCTSFDCVILYKVDLLLIILSCFII